jgi:hypothetical protein
VKYDELVTLIVPKGRYAVTGEVALDKEYEVDHTAIARVE